MRLKFKVYKTVIIKTEDNSHKCQRKLRFVVKIEIILNFILNRSIQMPNLVQKSSSVQLENGCVVLLLLHLLSSCHEKDTVALYLKKSSLA